jgi:hypothetical protein
MGYSIRFKQNAFITFLILDFFLGLCIVVAQQQVNGQLIPIPPSTQPPPKTSQFELQAIQGKNNNYSSTGPPVIESLTNSLVDGKNTFRVKITDKSDLKYSEIRYVRNGNIITEQFVRDPDNIYKVLIDVHPPSAIIVVNAIGMDGQSASLVKELNVSSLPNYILGQTFNVFFNIGKSIVSLFVSGRY